MIALVDYDNDCVETSLDVARALEDRLWGVRLDTSETMVDKSVVPQMGAFTPTGVNADSRLERAQRARRRGVRRREDRRVGRVRRRAHPRVRGGRRARSTPTAWAPRCSTAASISPPTSCR